MPRLAYLDLHGDSDVVKGIFVIRFSDINYKFRFVKSFYLFVYQFPSRSARRKKAKRQWLREKLKGEKEEVMWCLLMINRYRFLFHTYASTRAHVYIITENSEIYHKNIQLSIMNVAYVQIFVVAIISWYIEVPICPFEEYFSSS